MSKQAKFTWLVGGDHRGVELRDALADWLKQHDHEVQIFGPATKAERSDAPLIIDEMVPPLLADDTKRGIFCCGTGGMPSVRSNRYNGLRSMTVGTPHQAKLAKTHGGAHMLIFGADVTPFATALEAVSQFINNEFIGHDPAYKRRLDQLDAPLAK